MEILKKFKQFSFPEDEEKLKSYIRQARGMYYTYALANSHSNRIYYVGKGRGYRCLSHVGEHIYFWDTKAGKNKYTAYLLDREISIHIGVFISETEDQALIREASLIKKIKIKSQGGSLLQSFTKTYKSYKKRKYTPSEFCEKVYKVYGKEMVQVYSDTYIGQGHHVKVRCKTHNLVASVKPSTVLEGKAFCRECFKELLSESCSHRTNDNLKTDVIEAKNRVEKTHGDVFLYDKFEYVGYHCEVTLGCKVKGHGYFTKKYGKIVQKNKPQGCAKCTRRKVDFALSEEIRDKVKNGHSVYNFEFSHHTIKSVVGFKGVYSHDEIISKHNKG